MELSEQFRASRIYNWAKQNYDQGGHWIVETMSLSEIAEEFATLACAKKYCKILVEQEENIKNA